MHFLQKVDKKRQLFHLSRVFPLTPGGTEIVRQGVTEGVRTDGYEVAINDVGEGGAGRMDGDGDTALTRAAVVVEVHPRSGLVAECVLGVTYGFGVEVLDLVNSVVEVDSSSEE